MDFARTAFLNNYYLQINVKTEL